MATPAKSKTRKTKLGALALRILTTVDERKGQLMPESIGASGQEVEKIVKELLARELIEECPAKLEEAIWRTDEQQRPLTLRITPAGHEALAAAKVSAEAAVPASPAKPQHSNARTAKRRTAKASKASSSQRKQGTKAERILALLRRPEGATIAELTKSTGWQPHSVRGFLSGTLKRKMKLKLKSERPESKERRYRVA